MLRWGWISILIFAPFYCGFVASPIWEAYVPWLRPIYGSEWWQQPPKPTGDGPDYEAIGYCISRGEGWSTHFSDAQWRSVYASSPAIDYSSQLSRVGPLTPETSRPPLLPLVIGMIYRIVPRGPVAFAMIRLGLGLALSFSAMLAVLWGIAIAERLNRRSNLPQGYALRVAPLGVAVATLGIVVTERNVCNYATDFLTEPMALFVTTLFLVVAWYGTRSDIVSRPTWYRWPIVCGLLFSGMYFCRSLFVLWIPMVVVWLWFSFEQKDAPERRRRWLALFLVTMVVAIGPWWVRNCWVLESFSPLGTKGATTLVGGYSDVAVENWGEWSYETERTLRNEIERREGYDPATASAAQALGIEKELAREAAQRVRRWALEHIDSLPKLVGMRLLTEWNPYTGKALVLKIAAVVGIVGLWRRDRNTLAWLLGPLVINSIVVAATYSVGGRFLVPTYVPFYLLSALGIVFAWGWLTTLGRNGATRR